MTNKNNIVAQSVPGSTRDTADVCGAGRQPILGASADAETRSREPSPDGLGPTGFDPARLKERIAEIEPTMLAAIVKRAADDFYCAVMETAEDYLRENLEWNISSHISMLERELQQARTEIYEVDRALGGSPLGHESRIRSIGELQTATNRYHSMVWQVAQKHDGEERHETALRYIREREAASGMEAQRAATEGAVHDSPTAEGGDARKQS